MSDELIQRVRSVIASVKRVPQEQISLDASFQELGIDSMDGVEILFALENEFDINIPDEAAKSIRSVREMAEGVARLLASKSAEATS